MTKGLTLNSNLIANIPKEEAAIQVLDELKVISKSFGFKMPDGDDESDNKAVGMLVSYVLTTHGSLEVPEITRAFMMAVEGKINFDLASYGHILTIPKLAGVLNKYKQTRNLKRYQKETPKKDMELSEKEKAKLNFEAAMYWVDTLETTKNLNARHYNIIDKYLYAFPDDLKVSIYKEELEKEITRIEEVRINKRLSKLEFQALEKNVESEAKRNSKVRLAHQYLDDPELIINYPELEQKIKEDYGILDEYQMSIEDD